MKSALFAFEANPEPLARRAIAKTGEAAVDELMSWVDRQAPSSAIAAIGHRIVHGGPLHREPQANHRRRSRRPGPTDAIRAEPPAEEIALIDALAAHRPGVPQVACFDTAFHRDLPEVARRLPIPAVYDARGIQRYGFHGLSCAFLMEELSRGCGAATSAAAVWCSRISGTARAWRRSATDAASTPRWRSRPSAAS